MFTDDCFSIHRKIKQQTRLTVPKAILMHNEGNILNRSISQEPYSQLAMAGRFNGSSSRYRKRITRAVPIVVRRAVQGKT
jgi:hypothetical protein